MFESAQTRVLRRTRLRAILDARQRSGPNGLGEMRKCAGCAEAAPSANAVLPVACRV